MIKLSEEKPTSQMISSPQKFGQIGEASEANWMINNLSISEVQVEVKSHSLFRAQVQIGIQSNIEVKEQRNKE